MGILDFISGIFKPAAELVDNLHTSDEEKLTLKAQMNSIATAFGGKLIELEKALVEARSKTIVSEANGHSWLQRNWRPVTMLVFVAIIVQVFYGMTPEGVTEKMVLRLMDIIEIGLGGYIVGRSVEKTAPAIIEVMKKNR